MAVRALQIILPLLDNITQLHMNQRTGLVAHRIEVVAQSAGRWQLEPTHSTMMFQRMFPPVWSEAPANHKMLGVFDDVVGFQEQARILSDGPLLVLRGRLSHTPNALFSLSTSERHRERIATLRLWLCRIESPIEGFVVP
jgi:hypothetical protein